MFAKKRIVSSIIAMTLLAAMTLTACTQAPGGTASGGASSGGASSGDTASGGTTPTGTNQYPGTKEANSVTINIAAEPPKMFSMLTTDTVSMNVLRHLVVGLTTLDQNDKAVPGVASDWTISDDQLVYTFNLRKDFKWSNGEPVTAKDFEFAFKGLLDSKFAAPYSYLAYNFKNGQAFAEGKAKIEDVGVKVIDDYKLELTLEQPTPYLLDLLAFGVLLPVNQKAYEEFGDKYGTDANKMVYNGAYTLTEWSHENQMVLTKNPDYPMAADIKIEKLIFKMIADSNTAMNSFKSGELDMMGLNGDQLAELKAAGQPTYSYNDGGNWYLEYNTKDKVFSNKKVRQAMTIAIDSENFVKKLVKNDSLVATSFTSHVIQGNKDYFANEVGDLFKPHDIEKAKTLLDEAKKELGIDKISVTMLIDDGDTAAKHAAFLQEAWSRDLGIEVKVEQMPFKSRLARMEAKDFQVVMAGWGPDYNDPMTYLDLFETGNGNNHTYYSNPAYDELLNKVRKEADRDKRFGYLMELEKILMDDMPVGPYYFRFRDYTVSNKLEGMYRSAFQDFNLLWASIK